MNGNFFKVFLNSADKIYEEGNKLKWSIPSNANKNKGEYGLLPEDIDIQSWQIPPTTAQLLYFLVLSNRSKSILELGTSIGYSTIWLALGAKEVDGHVQTIENFEGKIPIAKKNFKDAKVDDYITLHEKDIIEVLTSWDKRKKVDFVFMDADKQRYGTYFDYLYPIMKKNALMVVDNVGDYPQYMKEFLNKMKLVEGSATHILSIDHGLLLFSKNSGTNMSSKMHLII